MDLSNHRLVYVAPSSGSGGVGDYADDFAQAASTTVGDLVEIRHGSPGEDSIADLRQWLRVARKAVDDGPPGRVILHAELSGGAMVPYWTLARLGRPEVKLNATVHDPPGLVWWPGRTRFVARHRLLLHGMHYPVRRSMRRAEARVASPVELVALTDAGAAALRANYPSSHVRAARILVPERREIAAAAIRPRAVGLFGVPYRSKGFEMLAELRSQLPSDIAIRVAGRGTESLPRVEGVDFLGAVEGPDEDAFFESVRLLILPYDREASPYGTFFPASSVAARALAYRTPVVGRDSGPMREAASEGGVLLVEGNAPELARAASAIIDDSRQLSALASEADALALARDPHRIIESFADMWAGHR